MARRRENTGETQYQQWVREEKTRLCNYLGLEVTPENFEKVHIHTYYRSY